MTRIFVALTLAMVAAGCGRTPHESTPEQKAAVPVTVAEVRRMPLRASVEAGGTVSARETALVSSRIMAPVVSVLVAPGDRVREGQPVIRLDGRALSADHTRAEAAARAAEYGRRGADAAVASARSAVALAEVTHKRITRLHERRSATDAELDHAVAELAAARSRLDQAAAGLSGADAALESSTAGATAAAVTRSWATITAPFAGVVTQKLVEPGNMAVPGAPLLRIESEGAPRVEVRLDASRAAHVRPGDVVTASIEPQGGTPVAAPGRVVEVARAVDAGAQTFLVKADLSETAGVPAGTFARLRFPGPERMALAVPLTAIVRQGQLTSVFVVEGDRTHLRLVTTGTPDGERVEVTAGLEPGERVVLSPAPTLADGARVNATRAAGSESAPSAPGGADLGRAGEQ